MLNKKGLSLIVGVVILITLTITMAGIIFSWSGSFISKLSPPIDCSQIGFEAEIYNEGGNYFLGIVNSADVPLKGLVIKSIEKGESLVRKEVDIDVQPGATDEITLEFIDSTNAGDKFLVVPKISIKDSNGIDIIKVCDDKNGFETAYKEIVVG